MREFKELRDVFNSKPLSEPTKMRQGQLYQNNSGAIVLTVRTGSADDAVTFLEVTHDEDEGTVWLDLNRYIEPRDFDRERWQFIGSLSDYDKVEIA